MPGLGRPRGTTERLLTRCGEVAAHDLGLGVVGAQHPHAVGQGLLVAAGWPGPGPPPPGRRRRGCSARSGCRGGRRPAPAAGRPGSARTAGWPGPGPPPPGRRRRGCSARSGCRGWSAPSTRTRSARVCSYSGMARPRSPALGRCSEVAREVRVRRVCSRRCGRGLRRGGRQVPAARRAARGSCWSARACSNSGMARPRSPPPGRRRRGCRGGSGCRGGRRPGTPLPVGEGLLEQRDGPAQVPRPTR